MRTRRPTGDTGDESACDGALAGLARQVESHRRELDAVAGVPGRVDDLAHAVAQLADAVSAFSEAPSRSGPIPAPSWLTAPTDPAVTGQLLDGLTGWLHAVFLRYPDGAAALPDCWLAHPDVIEELLWLMHAWLGAYRGRGASVQAAGDWHDRQRTGAVRRIRAQHGSCSVENHQQRPGWSTTPAGAAAVPGLDTTGAIARWWAIARDDPAPEPPAAHRNGARP